MHDVPSVEETLSILSYQLDFASEKMVLLPDRFPRPSVLSRPGLHVSQRTVPSIEFMNITRAANGKCERVRNGAVKDAGEASGRDVHACVHHGMAGEVRDHAFHALIVAARMASRGRDWPDVRPRL
jgi:hypothetical protein